MASSPPPPPRPGRSLCFEVAWEVCQKVGGIYTVVKTKVPAMLERWGDNYCLIGPYNPQTAAIEFEETSADEPVRSTLRELKRAGISCYFGRWLVPGKPKVLLLDHKIRHTTLDTDKFLLWQNHGITTPRGDVEVNDAVSFGFTVFEFFKTLCERAHGLPILAHFHEWQSGVGLLRMAHHHLPVATIFTTHATLLGRYIAASNPHFYEEMEHIDPAAAAQHYNISARYHIERYAAHAATVFTTVSEPTSREAEKFLGRRPEFILPNGLNVQRFTALHEFQNLHSQYKERINEFVMGHFFPSYTFNLDRTIYLFTSGRYEYRNKGIDLFIESLYHLNRRLKEMPNPPTVVAFIITKAAVKNVNVGAMQSRLMLDELTDLCSDFQKRIAQKVLAAAVNGRLPAYEDLISNDFQVQLKRATHAFKRNGLPSIVTHDLVDDAGDPVLQHLRHRELFNQPSDPVKVVFHPDFLSATNPLIGLDYEQFARGCHLGVFPSYYEPWGYTPPECIALGIPTITTDLSGFGDFALKQMPESEQNGVYVLRRQGVATEQSIQAMAKHMFDFSLLSRRERIERRYRTERLADLFDWATLVQHYHKAHDDALQKKFKWEVPPEHVTHPQAPAVFDPWK